MTCVGQSEVLEKIAKRGNNIIHTYIHKDIANTRMNWPMGQFSDNIDICIYIVVTGVKKKEWVFNT